MAASADRDDFQKEVDALENQDTTALIVALLAGALGAFIVSWCLKNVNYDVFLWDFFGGSSGEEGYFCCCDWFFVCVCVCVCVCVFLLVGVA